MPPLPGTDPNDPNEAGGESDAGHVAADSPGASDPKDQLAVLLLEDDPYLAEPLCDILTFAGYRCVIARNETFARQELAKPDQAFAIMVADLNLSRDDHAAFVREVRSLPRYASLPCIITTGHDSRQAREQALLLGRMEYLVKPFANEILLQRIARWTHTKP